MDFLKVSYTGRIKDGPVVDTTDEKTAKDNKIFDEKRIYKPVPVAVGGGHMLEGLDDALKGMKPGDKKKVTVQPEKGYGQKNPELVRLVPLKHFKQQKITPIPGMPIEIDGRTARIQTVAGGRVRVDFNNELAGKTLEYEIKVEEKAKNDSEKIRYLLERAFGKADGFDVKATEKPKKVEITLPDSAYKDRNILLRKASLAADIFKLVDYPKVKFSEVWEKPEKSR
ncbi:MAG: FKBP-type peptidyl-prolyl cis-trans isomerase [Candidatus Altiarchaeota archaeon]